MKNVLHKSIKEIKTLPSATPEILEQIAHKAYMDSNLDNDLLCDDQDGGPGGFCQLYSTKMLQQYLIDGTNDNFYGTFNNAKNLFHSCQKNGLSQAINIYNATLKHPHALWYLEDNDWPDTARLATAKNVIGCFKNIIINAHYADEGL